MKINNHNNSININITKKIVIILIFKKIKFFNKLMKVSKILACIFKINIKILILKI